MLGVHKVPLLRLSWGSFSTFVMGGFGPFSGKVIDPDVRTKENTQHIKANPCYFRYSNLSHKTSVLSDCYIVKSPLAVAHYLSDRISVKLERLFPI